MKFITQTLLFWCLFLIGDNIFPESDVDYTLMQNAFSLVGCAILFLGCGSVIDLLERLIKHLNNIEND